MNSVSPSLLTDERLTRGYVIVLPGIEGYSWLNRRIVRGLVQAEVPYAIEIHDWTCRWPMMLYNLRSERLHTTQALLVREMILSYQSRWPQRPVYLVGHSGGGAMVLRILESLPKKKSITSAVMLGAAVSPGYDYRPALEHVDRKIWNFTSMGDFLFLGLFTMAAGTLDGQHSASAGMVGFRQRKLTIDESEKFEEMPYRLEYCRDWHLAGHFGFTAPRFVQNWVAPLLMTSEVKTREALLEAGKISDCIVNATAT